MKIVSSRFTKLQAFRKTINLSICGVSRTNNKPAAQTAGQTLPNATPPVSKIPPFSKIALTFEPIQLDWTGSTILNRFGVMAP